MWLRFGVAITFRSRVDVSWHPSALTDCDQSNARRTSPVQRFRTELFSRNVTDINVYGCGCVSVARIEIGAGGLRDCSPNERVVECPGCRTCSVFVNELCLPSSCGKTPA